MNNSTANNINNPSSAFYSIKNAKVLRASSLLENDFYYIFESNTDITSYDTKPFDVNISSIDGTLYKYTPACVLEKKDTYDCWIEFVTSNEFFSNSTHYEKMFAEIKQAAEILKVDFIVLNENDINTKELQIAKMEYILSKKALLNKQLNINLIAA